MDEIKSIDWTKQNPEMNEHDKVFCDTLVFQLKSSSHVFQNQNTLAWMTASFVTVLIMFLFRNV